MPLSHRSYVVLALLLPACSVGSDSPDEQPSGAQFVDVPERPARTKLRVEAAELAGKTVDVETKGAWRWRHAEGRNGKRRVARGRRGGGPGAGGPTTGSDDFYLGATRASGPATGGPAGPSGPAPTLGAPAASAVTGGAVTGGPSTVAAGSPGPTDRGRARRPNAVLRAGSRDDNRAFDEFLAYVAGAQDDPALAKNHTPIDVRDRRFVSVVDTAGKPQAGVAVTIVDEARDKVVWYGTTYGDGRVPFYPHAVGSGAKAEASSDSEDRPSFLIEARVAEGVVQDRWDGSGDPVLTMPPRAAGNSAVVLDVAFVVDTTGSMQDEMQAIKSTLLQVTERLRELELEFDLRYGAVLYRDMGDEYVTATHPLTADIEGFANAIRGMGAGGGGDYRESMNQALAVAVDGLEWRDGAAKVAFVIADAPPHLDYADDVPYDRTLRAAVANGVRLHTVAASGLDPSGTLVLRQVAQFTRGQFVFIEYGRDLKASAKAHGIANPGTGNNLHEILFERIRDEVAGWGRSSG